jgi:hypothetical protein
MYPDNVYAFGRATIGLKMNSKQAAAMQERSFAIWNIERHRISDTRFLA